MQGGGGGGSGLNSCSQPPSKSPRDPAAETVVTQTVSVSHLFPVSPDRGASCTGELTPVLDPVEEPVELGGPGAAVRLVELLLEVVERLLLRLLHRQRLPCARQETRSLATTKHKQKGKRNDCCAQQNDLKNSCRTIPPNCFHSPLLLSTSTRGPTHVSHLHTHGCT